jgi:beta-lactam-binding protein with PASTA domain
MSYTKKFLQVAALMMGMLALVLISSSITMKVVTWGRTVDVPNLSGQEVTSASASSRNRAGDKDREAEHHPLSRKGIL